MKLPKSASFTGLGIFGLCVLVAIYSAAVYNINNAKNKLSDRISQLEYQLLNCKINTVNEIARLNDLPMLTVIKNPDKGGQRDMPDFIHKGKDGNFTSFNQLGNVLKDADMETWIKDLGSPQCHYDIEIWHNLGNKILKLDKKTNE